MIKKVILTVATIIWMIVIFSFSNQQSEKSSHYSESFIENTIVNIYKLFDRNASEEKLKEVVATLNGPVRKLAHFTEYFILGILMFFMLREYNVRDIYVVILACFLYAVTDEIHQLFVAGRNGNFFDVLIDTSGSTLAVLLLMCKIKFR